MKTLTIGITSYNRVKEVDRSLRSIDSKYLDDIEIIVSEDKSPRRKEIEEVVAKYAADSKYPVTFNSNEKNLGYDRNLKKLISLSNAKYILYLSDDDRIIPGSLDKLIELLRSIEVGAVYTAFCQGEGDYRRYYKKSYNIPKGVEYINSHVYDSILFSGLVYNVGLVKDIDAERFLNKNYFQVYMFLYSIYKMGGYYLSEVLIDAVGDGENGYGIAESSGQNSILANRESIFSILEFHKGLFSVIKMFDEEFKTNVFSHFSKEYNLHSISGMAIARIAGVSDLKRYWEVMSGSSVKMNLVSYVYYYMLLVLGSKATLTLLSLPKRAIKLIRNEK